MSDLKRFRAGYLEWRDSEDGDEDNVIAYTEALEARVAELEAAALSFVEGISFTDHHVRRMREFSVLVDTLAAEEGDDHA